jgi:hypothetical protein
MRSIGATVAGSRETFRNPGYLSGYAGYVQTSSLYRAARGFSPLPSGVLLDDPNDLSCRRPCRTLEDGMWFGNRLGETALSSGMRRRRLVGH